VTDKTKNPKKAERTHSSTVSAKAAATTSLLAPVLAVFRHDPRVTSEAGGHGGATLRVGDVVFARILGGDLAVKFEPALAEGLVGEGRGRLLVMGVRTMKQWVVIDVDADLLRTARDQAVDEAASERP